MMGLFAQLQETFFREPWYERLIHPSIIIPFCIFGLPMIVWGVKSVIASNAKARVLETELQLKRELVAQGRSAEEIERIMGDPKSRRLDA
jgi:hypothetical protein